MYDLIKNFPEQITSALEIGEKAKLNGKFENGIKNIVIAGLGGSGIGGNLLSELLRDELKVPVIVNKGYSLPAFVDSSTLVILCSYSGNTEETLSCTEQVLKKGLHPVCITSGGKLGEIAEKNKLDVISIPGGFPPRSCLGFAITELFYVLHHYGLIGDGFKAMLKQSSELLKTSQAKMMQETEKLAASLSKKIIIAYAEDKYESTVLRFKQQVNENGKGHCWYNVVPELNHNELVGWREQIPNLALLIFRTSDENPRNTQRLLFTKDVAKKVSENVYEVEAKGNNAFEKRFYLIHFGDWLTYYLALQGGYDPIEIDVLLKLKEHMATIK